RLDTRIAARAVDGRGYPGDRVTAAADGDVEMRIAEGELQAARAQRGGAAARRDLRGDGLRLARDERFLRRLGRRDELRYQAAHVDDGASGSARAGVARHRNDRISRRHLRLLALHRVEAKRGWGLAAPTLGNFVRDCEFLRSVHSPYGSFCSSVRMFWGMVLAWATIAVLACCRICAFDRLEVAWA